MALFKNPFGGSFVTNLAIGVGAAILTPFVVPIVAKFVKPMAKNVVKGGILISEVFTGRRDVPGEGAGPGKGGETGGPSGGAAKASGPKYAVARPLAKSVVKGGIVAYEKGKQVLSEAGDGVRELVAEAKAEMAQMPAAAPEGNPPAGAAEKAPAAKTANPPAAKKTVRKATGTSARKPASDRPATAKRATPKTKKEG
jgi:hypothetical protein